MPLCLFVSLLRQPIWANNLQSKSSISKRPPFSSNYSLSSFPQHIPLQPVIIMADNSKLSIVWDMDGVLLDSEPIHVIVENELVGEYGKDIETITHKLLGRRALEAAQITVRELELPLTAEQYLAKRDAGLIKKMPSVEILPGIFDTVKHIRAQGVTCAIATSSPKHLLEAKKIGKSDFFSMFDAIVCGDDVTNGKPDPEVFLKAAKAINADPKNCVVFEDAPSGVRAGRAAGMRVCALPNPIVDIEVYKREDPTWIVPSARILDFDLTQIGLPPMDKSD